MSGHSIDSVPDARRRNWFCSLWGRRWAKRDDPENYLPKTPPSTANGSNRRELVAVPPPVLGPRAASAPSSSTTPHSSSVEIEAEIYRVTTPQPLPRGSIDSPSTPGDGDPMAGSSLSGDIETIRTKKIWWWQRSDRLKARMSAVILSGGFFAFTLSICTAPSPLPPPVHLQSPHP